jgi:hypothetical protein
LRIPQVAVVAVAAVAAPAAPAELAAALLRSKLAVPAAAVAEWFGASHAALTAFHVPSYSVSLE